MNGEPIHILLVSEAREAFRLRELLESNGSSQFRVTHVPGIDPSAQCLAREGADILLLDIGPDQSRGLAMVRASATAAPQVPTVILSDSESESLAVESLQQGAQDFLSKGRLDGAGLARSLRYAIERHRLQRTLQILSLAEQLLRLILRKGSGLLVFVDLDDLKSINDTHGHLEGNRALTATANILRACFRQSDILGRVGGDEFCVLMTDACQDSAVQVRKRLQHRVDFTNAVSASRFRLSLSVGIAEVPAVRQPPLEELLRLADALMYEQKRNKQAHASVKTARLGSTARKPAPVKKRIATQSNTLLERNIHP